MGRKRGRKLRKNEKEKKGEVKGKEGKGKSIKWGRKMEEENGNGRGEYMSHKTHGIRNLQRRTPSVSYLILTQPEMCSLSRKGFLINF